MLFRSKFKTNLFAIFLTTPLNRQEVTKNALIGTILRRGCKEYNTQEKISKELEEMYGASFDCGIEKAGDNQVIKFYMEIISPEYLPEDKNLSKEAIEMLLKIVFDPYVENQGFKEEYMQGEKQKIKQIIEGKIDDKASYALEKCIETMYKNEPYGLYKFGYIEDLEKINAQELYNYYKQMIQKCKIDIFASGNIEEPKKLVEGNRILEELQARNANIKKEEKGKEKQEKAREITENMEVMQGKLVDRKSVV